MLTGSLQRKNSGNNGCTFYISGFDARDNIKAQRSSCYCRLLLSLNITFIARCDAIYLCNRNNLTLFLVMFSSAISLLLSGLSTVHFYVLAPLKSIPNLIREGDILNTIERYNLQKFRYKNQGLQDWKRL